MTDAEFLSQLAAIVGPRHLITARDELKPALTDWRSRYHGAARALVLPGSTAEVAAVVKACAAARVPMVPQGGNTGLVGGATPDASGQAVVIKMQRMHRVVAVDATGNTLTAESGCVLAEIQHAARRAGRLFPLSLASEGSCTLGGNLSTNAGGTAVLRYGNTRELCLALEAVMADGSVIGSRDGVVKSLRKDNTGLALSQLMIGAEGTLGIITQAVMKLFALPKATVTALAAVPSVDAALRLLATAQEHCGPGLTAFELMNELALHLVERHFKLRYPFAARHPYVVLLELSDAEDDAHAMHMLETLVGQALETGMIDDALVAHNQTQSKQFWALRENISEAQAAEGTNIKHDISIPIAHIAQFVAQTDAALTHAFDGVRMVNFGHLGDGNLHYNVSPAPGQSDAELVAKQAGINALVYESVERFNGSISAEHGVGQLKREALPLHRSAAELGVMRQIKAALDPLGLMNPGKML